MKTLQDILIRASVRNDKGVGFINDEDDIMMESYAELYEKSLKILGYFQKNGLKKLDKLIFQITNNHDFLNIFWACVLGGIIPVPLVVDDKSEFMHKLFQVREKISSSKVICSNERKKQLMKFAYENDYFVGSGDAEFIDVHDAVRYEGDLGNIAGIQEEDTAFIQFSSGSTGNPKGIVLTNKNLLTNLKAIAKGTELKENDVSVYWLPLTHDMGIIGCHLTQIYNMNLQYIMTPQLFIQKPALWLEKLSEYKATLIGVSDFGLQYVLSTVKSNYLELDLSNIRLLLNGAEPISVKTCKDFFEEMKNFGLKETTLFTVYGMAEATLAVTFPALGEGLKYVAINREKLQVGNKIYIVDEKDTNASLYVEEGKTVDGVDLRICNEEGEIVGDEVFGHIQIKGESVSKGYFNEKDNEGVLTEDKWFITGDMGFTYKGNLVVVGRDKEVLIINGYNYFSNDLERIACRIDGIDKGKVMVTDVYDKNTGKEKIAVFVVFSNQRIGFDKIINKLQTLYRQSIGINVDYIIPIDTMEKTPSGKIARYKYKKDFENGSYDHLLKEVVNIAGHETINTTKVKIENELIEICQDALQDMFIDRDTNLHEAGINSIIIMKIYESIREKYGDMLDIEDLFMCNNISDIAAIIYEGILHKSIGNA